LRKQEHDMASKGRYISPRDFGVLIADLRLAPTIFQEPLLEFLEKQRIVLPVARVRWPISLVIEAREEVPSAPPTDEEREQSRELSEALRLWHRFDADPDVPHPLDRDAQPGRKLICTDVGSCPFEPWESFRTNIRPEGDQPLYVPDAVDTYYHDWQVLLVADALDMGTRVIFDTRQPDLMKLALHDVRDLPADAAWQQVSFRGPRGLAQGLQWARYFDASARVESLKDRKFNAIARVYESVSFTLTDADQDDLNATHKHAAERMLAAVGASPTELRAFLTYLCERWDEWTGRGRQEIAAEYKRQIALAARMIMQGQRRDFSALAEDIGRATGHFENSLNVIFPDWTKEAREKVELSLKYAVVARAPIADASLTLTDADIPDVLDWLEHINLWKVHLSIETVLARQFSGSRVDHVALAKEVESMSTTFEHVVNALLDQAGVQPAGTLMNKVQRFWNAFPEIHLPLLTGHGLVSTRSKTRTDQIASIRSLTATGLNIDVTRTILSAVLYRNDGQHNAMVAWSEEELHEANRVFLTAIMFCRKNLLTNPPNP
jgi:hypothetical protein